MANIDRWFLRIAVIYALVAMFLGITMGIREDFTQAPTHAHLNLVGWVSMALYAFGLSPIPRGGPKSVCDATFLDRQCRRCATDGGDLYPDGGYALASIYRDLGFFHHDSRYADFHRDRVFESLGSRRRVEAEFSSPFPADFSSPRR